MGVNFERQVSSDISSILEHDLPWQEFSGAKVLVTGASGFLGFYLVRVLLALNKRLLRHNPVKVVALVRNVEAARVKFYKLLKCEQLELMSWDLNVIDIPSVKNLSYIFHAASQASPKFYGSDPVGTLLPNTVGTAALLTLCARQSSFKGFLFVSSSEVYGSVVGKERLAEQDYGIVDPAVIRSCYAESKRMGETMCVSWGAQYNIPVKIVRPFHTYGPGLNEFDGRVFADFAFNIINNKDINMMSDGSSVRAFCYVSDAIAGIFYTLFRGEQAKPYNLANEEAGLSIRELADLLVGLFPAKGLKVNGAMREDDGYVQSQYSKLLPDTTALRKLGWSSSVAPREGFEYMIKAHL